MIIIQINCKFKNRSFKYKKTKIKQIYLMICSITINKKWFKTKIKIIYNKYKINSKMIFLKIIKIIKILIKKNKI